VDVLRYEIIGNEVGSLSEKICSVLGSQGNGNWCTLYQGRPRRLGNIDQGFCSLSTLQTCYNRYINIAVDFINGEHKYSLSD
jgi:hypothetical protein